MTLKNSSNKLLLCKKLEDMNLNELWLLRWYMSNEDQGYRVYFNIFTREYEVDEDKAA